ENGIVPEHILEVSGMDMLIEFVKTGIGVACVIKRFVEKELEDGSLIEIPLSVPINKREVGFAYLKSTKPTSAMDRFMNFCENYPS
ncbi:MAG: LysR family transcriptional regulator substrate-binding protein, partial [Oscillospiraceae bacterium]|nr:LysR family transcriptional regulator substrate-binding protein [Oscillospiraceae bacterium]